MTYKEAIAQMDSLIENSEDFHAEKGDIWERDIEALNLAKAALEKQIPKEPELKPMAGFDVSVASHLACPNCGGGVTNYWVPGTKPAHCQFCGQALKWPKEVKK